MKLDDYAMEELKQGLYRLVKDPSGTEAVKKMLGTLNIEQRAALAPVDELVKRAERLHSYSKKVSAHP